MKTPAQETLNKVAGFFTEHLQYLLQNKRDLELVVSLFLGCLICSELFSLVIYHLANIYVQKQSPRGVL